MDKKDANDIRNAVRERYGSVAQKGSPCCGITSGVSCCSPSPSSSQDVSKVIGYSNDEIESVPEGANLGLGCGNPVALAAIRKGDTVLDLGSGAGFDSFLAARGVGETGRVIGVDMTPAMISKARQNAREGSYENVEFRLGEIENLPVADNSVDLVLSNCVINLSPDKPRVFAETFRVLKAGGRLMISDLVLVRPLPENIKNSIEAYVGCLAGAALKEEYLNLIKSAGFEDVEIMKASTFPIENITHDPVGRKLTENGEISLQDVLQTGSAIVSISVSGIKP